VQAPEGFGAGLLLGEDQFHLAEVADALIYRGGGNLRPWSQVHFAASQHLNHVLVAQLGHRQGRELAGGEKGRPAQIAVNGQRAAPPVGNGLDQRARSGRGIAPRKHPWPVGGQGFWVNLEGAPARDLQPVIGVEEADLRRLGHGGHHGITFNDEL